MIVFTGHNRARGGGEGHVALLMALCEEEGLEHTLLVHGFDGGLEAALGVSRASLFCRSARRKLRAARAVFLHAGPRDVWIALWCRMFTSSKVWVQVHVANPRPNDWTAVSILTRAMLWLVCALAHRVFLVSASQRSAHSQGVVIPPLTNLVRLGSHWSSHAHCGSDLRVLFCGRAAGVDRRTDSKGWLTAIDLISYLSASFRSVTVFHCGGGPLSATIASECKNVGVAYVPLGWQDDPFRELLSQRGLACLFLTSRSESFGLCVLEAQHVGIPSIVSEAVPDDALIVPDLCFKARSDHHLNATATEIAEFLMKSHFGRRDRTAVNEHQECARERYKNLLLTVNS